jgi:hypothetical protein
VNATAAVVVVVLLGIVGRTVVPYLEMLRNNPDTPFDRKFLVPAVVSVVIALITSPLVFAAIPPEQLSAATLPALAVLFAAAWGLTDVARAGQKLLSK